MIHLLLFCLLLGAGSAYGESVSLRQALDEAVSNRPLARAASEEARAAAAAVGEARSRLLPRLTLSESFYATDEPGGSLFIALNQEDLSLSPSADAYNFAPSRNDFETRLTLEQALYDPDVSYGLKRAKKGAEAAAAMSRRSRERAAFAAFQAYLEVQQAQAALGWVESSQKEAAEILRLAGERQQAGIGLKADVLRAQVLEARVRQQHIAVEHDLALARRSLALAMGRNGGDVDIAVPLTAALLAGTTGELPMARADLEALSLQVDEAELGYRQSRAAYLPRLGLSASYALHDADTPFGTDAAAWSIRAGMSWELFDGFRRSSQSERTAAGKRAAAARFEESAHQAGFQLEQSRLRAEEARLQVDVASRALAAAEEGQRLLLLRYEAGLDDLSAMLSTQESLDRCRFELVNANTRHILALGNSAFQNGSFLQALASAQEKSRD
ncbi:TolC family protein [Trichloromonas sp.]|uniref:TolC family protein n=1 Tax=Trichloromonas sp. TaxID=3069249 RepID=UPI003D817C25